ncbi:polyprenyl glycosylphosphotransferase [Mucilaginibacter xinganensis]|uniref:Polyprenyl glycosylphosphotransferase n=1 Tax=Mucilaginibacter xinganensis TaxID=1234841 RepID=A0A223P3P4_9SPHI|nr:polyprenyl glycosylphosphotransferase [Mucilaginibacter xinganensis]
MVIIGNGGSSSAIEDFISRNPNHGYQLVGFFCDDSEMAKEKEMYLGPAANCIDYVLNNKIDEIFCTLTPSENSEIERLMINADKHLIRFRFVPEYHNYGVKKLAVQSFGPGIAVIPLRPEPQEVMLNRFFKRAFDIIFSLFVIVFIFSWFFPLLAILIRLESKGPVIFKQSRSGRDNKPFMCYKFRSMRENDDSDKRQAQRYDHRITKIGAFIRRTSIDELPQFLNVLMGNMSVVGPRPHMVHHTVQYAQLIDKYMTRHFLKPGITGWAQIQGYRGETPTTESMSKRVEADVWYLENWSFLLDIKIIFSTIWISVMGDENAF